MSTIQPVVAVPLPNYAGEEAARPFDPAKPVAPISPIRGVTAIEAGETRPASAYPNPTLQDASTISTFARTLAETTKSKPDYNGRANPLNAGQFGENRSIRELIQSFRNYDNRAAVTSYNYYLNMFVRYGAAAPSISAEDGIMAALHAQENAVYDNLGISYTTNVSRENREDISRSIDRWFVGEGVFFPAMLHYTSSDGFSFTPLTAKVAGRVNDVMASYDRNRIAAFLREMARLTPRDFMFFDYTGLNDLGLQQRRDFLRFMDALLVRADIDLHAADLRYSFDEQGRIQLDRLGVDLKYQEMLDLLRNEINTYYGQLRNSVHQYKAGIVSAALA